MFSGMFGAAGSSGPVMPFADGGVIAAPSYFPLGRGSGLAGEAGPEAILPLTRGADGRLGVSAAGGSSGGTVIVNIQTPDVESFARAESQVTASAGAGGGARTARHLMQLHACSSVEISSRRDRRCFLKFSSVSSLAGVDVGFDAVNLPVEVVILVDQPGEMRVAQLQLVNLLHLIREFSGDLMRGMAHNASWWRT
jgi:hypothetical protein